MSEEIPIHQDPDFQPDSTCSAEVTCILFGMCQVAMFIYQEMKYRRNPFLYSDDRLEAILQKPCNHSQAIAAREAAEKEFPDLFSNGSSGQIFPE